jgi:hypothetical protein
MSNGTDPQTCYRMTYHFFLLFKDTHWAKILLRYDLYQFWVNNRVMFWGENHMAEYSYCLKWILIKVFHLYRSI